MVLFSALQTTPNKAARQRPGETQLFSDTRAARQRPGDVHAVV